MTPEEKYNTHLWYVLKKLKEATLYATGKEKIATYLLAPDVIVADEDLPSHEQEVSLLKQLKDQGVIEVKEVLPTESDDDYIVRLDDTRRILFKPIEPTFSNWYERQKERKHSRPKVSAKDGLLNTPTHPGVIQEYLWVLNKIEKERQRTPSGEPIAYPVPKYPFVASGVPSTEQETLILRKLEQENLIKITEKTIPLITEFDPYENSQTIRAVEILDINTFQKYRNDLLNLREKNKTATTIPQPIMGVASAKNPYQPLIDVIDILLRKIAITPKNRLTRNQIKIHVAETTLPQNAFGAEELAQILNSLKRAGSISSTYKDGGIVSTRVRMPGMGGVDQHGATFFITQPNKELLIKEREKWMIQGGGAKSSEIHPLSIPVQQEASPLQKENGKEEKLEFNPTKSILSFNGMEIVISKAANSDPHELLQTIFKDKSRVWNTDEILDDWKFDTEGKTPKKKVYHAGKAVNRIVAQETKIKDFLDVNTKTVAINKNYLND